MEYIKKFWIYLLFLIAAISFFGGVIYYFYALNTLGVSIALIISLITTGIFVYINIYTERHNSHVHLIKPKIIKISENKMDIIWLAAYLVIFITCLAALFSARTADAIISPWQKLPWFYFLSFAAASAVFLFAVYLKNKYSLILTILHTFLSLAVAVIIYRLGYGYDPFIHNATIDLIKKTGSVEPKQLYYLGQYALVLIINKITFMPIFWIDKFLVPALAALFLPIALYDFCRKWFSDMDISRFAICLLFILPYGIFISTTPQNLAYLFLFLAILIGLTSKKNSSLILVGSLALAALVTQPVAGLPAIFFFCILLARGLKNFRLKAASISILLVFLALSLPGAFYFTERNLNAAGNSADIASSFNLESLIGRALTVPNQEDIILNLVYTYIFNIKFAIIALASIGFYLICKNRDHCRPFLVCPLVSLALLVSYLLTTFLPFQFLISYERTDYSLRILNVATLFLLPLVLVSLYAFVDKLNKQDKFIKISFLIFFALTMSAAHYASYPRYDNYFNSHGYAVSSADTEAVGWIADNTKGDYIVLANQQVSAAAIKEYGFAKYYKDNIFYYPVPTGGPLYPYFLDMVYKEPSRETMAKAMDLASVQESYFVLNKYWWAFPKILAEAKLSADSWQEIANGQVYVFKYKK